jgi:quinol monooxygenase YgiN
MPIMVVTRLRLRSPDLLDEFFTASVAILEQAQTSAGNLGSDAMAEAHDVWWTVSAWTDRAAIDAFIGGEPHLGSEERLDHLCDEATFVDWLQDSEELPDWQTSYQHLVVDGRSAALTNASPANDARSFPAPVVPPPA